MEKLKEKLFYIFFFLFSLFPFQYFYPKILVIITLLSISFIELFNKIKFKKFYLNWFLSFLLLNFIYLNYGGLKNLEVYRVYLGGYFFWIIIYMFIFKIKVKEKCFENIGKILEISYYIGVLILLILYINFNYFEIAKLNNIINFIKIERPGQYSKITGFIAAITPMIYISCFLISKNLHNYFKEKSLKIYFIMLINCIFIFITMRKVLIVLYPAIILINIFFIKIFKIYNLNMKKLLIKNIFLLIITFILLSNLKVIDFKNFSQYISKSFNYFSKEKYAGVDERKEQFYSLLEGIKRSPLIGEGVGAEVNIKRSDKYVGTYELSYIAKIFQTGLLGFGLWTILILSLLKKNLEIFKKTRKVYLLFYLSGTISILIINISNPYLGSFEFDWMLYSLLFIINNVSTKK